MVARTRRVLRVVQACVAGLLALAPGLAAALPLDLADPTPRPVAIRFERSAADLASDLRTPHEAFGPERLAGFASDGAVATIVLPGTALAAELGARALPGSATDWVLRLDVATGEVLSVAYSFLTAIFLAVDGPWQVVVEEGSADPVGFLPSFRACTGPPRCELVSGEAYDAVTGRLLAVGTASVDGLGAAFSRSDVALAEVPEPRASALLALAFAAAVACARRPSRRPPRRRLAPALGIAALLGAGCGPGIAISDPAADLVLLAPALDVTLTLEPPLAAGEAVEAVLERGLDAPGGPASQDLGASLALAADGASATLALSGLAPGRNRLTATRRAADASVVASAERILDRGGFHGPAGGDFGAAVLYRTLSRPSSLDPSQTRSIDVAVWYPSADPAAEPALAIELDLQAVLGAPVAAGAAALPTLVFSHGDCGWEGQSAYLLADLARAGFLVAAPAHAGNTVVDPGCNAFLVAGFAERLDDVRALLGALADWSAEPGGALAGLLDPARMGLVGFSAGGLTSIPIAFEDARVAALVALATPVSAPGFLPLPVPALLVAGELDTTAPPAITKFFIYDGLVAPRFMATLASTAHSNFATQCQTPYGDCVPGSEPVATLHARIRRVVRGFLGRHLAGDVRWESLLAAGDGVALLADP